MPVRIGDVGDDPTRSARTGGVGNTAGISNSVNIVAGGLGQGSQPDPREPRDNMPLSHYYNQIVTERDDLVYEGLGTIIGQKTNSNKNVTALRRGYIKENGPPFPNHSDNRPFALYFCFNPTDLTFEYDLSGAQGIWPPQTRSADQVGLTIAQAKTASVTLLFDRTYEVWQGDPPGSSQGPGPGTYGALWDARAAERLLGLYDNVPPGSPGQVTFLDFVFSQPSGSSLTLPNEPLGSGLPQIGLFDPRMQPMNFTGWISGLEILFSRFDTNMVPTRCEMSLSITVTIGPSQTATNPDPSGPSQSSNDGTSVTPSSVPTPSSIPPPPSVIAPVGQI